jgi:hypothetical protein
MVVVACVRVEKLVCTGYSLWMARKMIVRRKRVRADRAALDVLSGTRSSPSHAGVCVCVCVCVCVRTYVQGGVLLADRLHHGGVHGQQACTVVQPGDDVVQATAGSVSHLVNDLGGDHTPHTHGGQCAKVVTAGIRGSRR